MDALLAIASRREIRDYADRPLEDDIARQILDAGRLSGSSRNRQQRRFVVVESADARDAVAAAVHRPDNVRGAALVVAIAVHGKGPTSFDAGRAAQNMMLAAWALGVGSCPNGVGDADAVHRTLWLADGESVANVLSFGWPARASQPERRTVGQHSARADRRPLEELVQRV